MKVLAIALTALFVVGLLVPVWWWALAGMTNNVSDAWFYTDLLLAVGALFSWVAWDDLNR